MKKQSRRVSMGYRNGKNINFILIKTANKSAVLTTNHQSHNIFVSFSKNIFSFFYASNNAGFLCKSEDWNNCYFFYCHPYDAPLHHCQAAFRVSFLQYIYAPTFRYRKIFYILYYQYKFHENIL